MLSKLLAIQKSAEQIGKDREGPNFNLRTAFELIADLAAVLAFAEMEQEAADSGCKTAEEVTAFIHKLKKQYEE